MNPLGVLAILVGALVCAACGGALRNISPDLDQVRRLVRHMDCHDGIPPRILVDPRCADGICGVTCAPDRWQVPPVAK